MPGRPNLSIGPIVPRGPGRSYRFLDYFVAPDVDEEWMADYLALDEQVGAEDRARRVRAAGHRERRARGGDAAAGVGEADRALPGARAGGAGGRPGLWLKPSRAAR